MKTVELESTATTQRELAGKYLTFTLGHEFYAIPVLKVREIIRLREITPVPNMPAFVKGIVNLRGKLIPVTDLRLRFNMNASQNPEQACIIVVQTKLTGQTTKPMGLIVDAVEEVANLTVDDLEPTPDFGGALEADYILGMAKAKGVVKALLDIDRVLGGNTTMVETI